MKNRKSLESHFKLMNNINIPEHVDVAIIGGGMAGLSAAASLSEMGVKNIAVFESEKLAHYFPPGKNW